MKSLIYTLLAVIAVMAVMFDTGSLGLVMALAPLAVFDPEKLQFHEAEFLAMRDKYGKLYVIDVEIDQGEKYQFIARRPSRSLLNAIAGSKDNLDHVNDLIIKNMIVAGPQEYLEDGIVYGRVLKELAGIMGQGESFLSKA